MLRLAGAVALGALAAPVYASGGPPVPPMPQAASARSDPLDLAALAAASKTVTIAEDALRAALVKGTPDAVVFSTALDLGDGAAAVAWSECTKTGCRGSVATLGGGADHPKLGKQTGLVAPAKVFFADGFVFEPPSLADLDGDGVSEIVLHYRATEPPRAALGSLSHEYVAAYATKDLSLVFSHELRRSGGDSEEACHWTLGRSGNRLLTSGRCNTRACLDAASQDGCKPSREIQETWEKARGQKRYNRLSSRPSASAAAPLK